MGPRKLFGNGLNTVSESTVSNTELSEFFGPHRVPGIELSEFLSAYYLCEKANSASFSQNSLGLPQNSVRLSDFPSLNSTLETVFRPFPSCSPQIKEKGAVSLRGGNPRLKWGNVEKMALPSLTPENAEICPLIAPRKEQNQIHQFLLSEITSRNIHFSYKFFFFFFFFGNYFPENYRSRTPF